MKDLILEFKDILPDTILFSLKDQLTISNDIDSEVDRAAPEYGYWAIIAEKAEQV